MVGPPEQSISRDKLESLLLRVERLRAAGYRVVTPLGGTYGAWLLESESGAKRVLKAPWHENEIARARSTRRALARLAANDIRFPQILDYGHLPGIGTWYLQTHLPGRAIARLSPSLCSDAAELNLLLAGGGAAASDLIDWSAHVQEHTIVGMERWQLLLEAASAPLRSLARELADAVWSSPSALPHGRDLVHGDFLASQLLETDGRVSGVVDWDRLGHGDRGLDLALLFLNVHAQAEREHTRPDETALSALVGAGIAACNDRFAVYLAHHLIVMLTTVLGGARRATIQWRSDLARRAWSSFIKHRWSLK